jgi:FkbM family methyltransferase
LLAKRLAAAFRFKTRVRLYPIGLSDRSGVARLRVPVISGQLATGLATIAPENRLDEMATEIVDVVMERLNEFNIEAPAFIKIDVEGHEGAVLRGGLEMIEQWKPNLLIEAEERHRPQAVAGVLNILGPLNYEGFFLQDGAARPIQEFDPDVHQNSAAITGGHKQVGSYFNNFIFEQDGNSLRKTVRNLHLA